MTAAVRDLQVEVHGLTSVTLQESGVAAFAGTDADGPPFELAVYGRDASDAQWLRKVWRFCIYRDSGPTLLDQPAAAGGARGLPHVPGGARRHHRSRDRGGRRCGPAHDAALVTRLPAGRRLAALAADEVSDDDVTASSAPCSLLRQAGILRGALSPETVLITPEGTAAPRAAAASSSAPAIRTDRDLAAAVAAAAVVIGHRPRGRRHLPAAQHRDDPHHPG